jgi:glycosyltransferase involved in cell wall biosynthesis
VQHFARDVFLLDDLRAFFELYDLFRDEHPDVLHLNSSKAAALGTLAGLFAGVRRRIVTVHGLPIHEERSILSRFLIMLASWLTFFFATQVIILTKLDLTAVRRWPLMKNKLHLIRNGIAAPDYLSDDAAREELSASVQRPELLQAGTWIGTISELHRNKGIEYMLEACKTLVNEGSEFVFYVIGEGEERAALEAKVKELGLERVVVLAGAIPEAARYLPAFDIVTLSSIKEGLPYVVLEAALAERAIVASNVGGIPEIVDERSGRLVEARNPEALAAALRELLDSPALRIVLGTNAHDRVARTFNREKMLQDTVSLYES